MKLDQLRKIIREEVKAAVKEELQEMLNEAVKVASKPDTSAGYKPVTQKDISKTWSTGKISTGTVPLEEMINQTKAEMTNEDYKTIVNASSNMVPNFAQRQVSGGGGAGLDLNAIPGFNPAKNKAILDAANKKDKFRQGA
jgi:hypothetical protein|tara:strand:+ start:342 stop:761 length:420 start_codon:yes stop_codon:yes gene_type:complete